MWTVRACIPVGILGAFVAVGCTAAHEERADRAEAAVGTTVFSEGCSAPVRSDDGKFAALDICPAGATPGKLVRVELATGTTADIATYPSGARVQQLGAKGGKLFYGLKHASGTDVVIHDWSLGPARTIPAVAPAGAAGAFGDVGLLKLTPDASHVVFASAGGPLASQLFVASSAGTGAAVALDLRSPAAAVRWSASGGTFVGHIASPGAWHGEDLFVVETGGAAVAKLSGPKHVALTSFAFGQGGVRAQEPYDGTRVLGFKRSETEGAVVATADPKTGEETVLDAARILAIVTDLGPDVLYSRVTEPTSGSFVRELVKQPRAGGAKTVLVTGTGVSLDDLRYGFDPLAVSTTGAFGVFGTRNATGAELRFLVKLDASATPQKLEKMTVRDQAGDKVLVEDASTSRPTYKLLDLATGNFKDLGQPSFGAAPTLAGDGSVVEVVDCMTDEGTAGMSIKRTGGTDSAPPTQCEWLPWASTAVVTPGSPSVVFYTSQGSFPNYRFDYGIVP